MHWCKVRWDVILYAARLNERGRACLRGLIRWLQSIPEDRRWLPWLIAINLGGAVYGFNWYAEQLRHTPWVYWPVVPDSPGSALLFSFFLIGLALRRRWPLLEGVASMMMIKYGLWTLVVMSHYWLTTGTAPFESVHLSISHAGMAIESLLFLRVYRPGMAYGILGLAWLLFNDAWDYLGGTHPTLPLPEAIGWVSVFAVSLSLAAFALFLVVTRGERSGPWLQGIRTEWLR